MNGWMRDGIVYDLLVDISRDKEIKEGMTAQEIVNHIRWRILFYDGAHGQTLSNPTSGHEPLASHGLKIRVRSSS